MMFDTSLTDSNTSLPCGKQLSIFDMTKAFFSLANKIFEGTSVQGMFYKNFQYEAHKVITHNWLANLYHGHWNWRRMEFDEVQETKCLNNSDYTFLLIFCVLFILPIIHLNGHRSTKIDFLILCIFG